jgi:hypothetical protein
MKFKSRCCCCCDDRGGVVWLFVFVLDEKANGSLATCNGLIVLLFVREIKRENSDSSAMTGPDDSDGGDGSSSDVNKGVSMPMVEVSEGAVSCLVLGLFVLFDPQRIAHVSALD